MVIAEGRTDFRTNFYIKKFKETKGGFRRGLALEELYTLIWERVTP